MALATDTLEADKAPRRPSPVYEFDASRSRFSYALQDLRHGVAQPGLVSTLIRISFLQRYRGIVKGAFWVVFLAAATAMGLGLVYGRVLGHDAGTYLPYVTTGIIVWSLISSMINDGAGVFVAASGVFNETPIPKTLFVIRMVGAAALTFAFKLLVIAACFVFVGHTPTVEGVILAFAGLAMVLWTGAWLALGWGVVCARYRDLLQATSVALTFAFFVSAVFWYPERLGDYGFVVYWNPLYHYMNIVRGPLLGLDGVGLSFTIAAGCTAAAMIFGGVMFGLFARRLSYWT